MSSILVENIDGVAYITLNRPDKFKRDIKLLEDGLKDLDKQDKELILGQMNNDIKQKLNFNDDDKFMLVISFETTKVSFSCFSVAKLNILASILSNKLFAS